MRTWPAPHVPEIPGHGYPLRLSDPGTGEAEPVGEGAGCTLAVCMAGPAGGTHLADVAAAVTFDLVVRAWLDTGRDVRCVQVLLDEPSPATPDDLAAFALDMTALGVIPPDVLLAGSEVEGAPGRSTPVLLAVVVDEHLGGSCDVVGLGPGTDHADVEAAAALASRVVAVPAARSSAGAGSEASPLVTDLLARGVAPTAIRLALLERHYRGRGALAPDALDQAGERLDLWTSAVSGNGGPQTDVLVGEIREALADDLDTPRALRVMDAWSHLALSYGQPGGMTDQEVVEGAPGIAARALDALLGVRL